MSHAAPKQMKCGVIQSSALDDDRVVEGELIQCCHCQFTCLWVPGLEKGWGLCHRCSDWHCGKPSCRECHGGVKQWLENRRTGRPDDYKPIRARVDAEPPRSPGGVILGGG